MTTFMHMLHLRVFFIIFISEVNSDNHGLTSYRDMYIVNNVETDSTDDNRPYITLPSGLSIKMSSVHGAGLGVWTERDYPANTRFGPFEGIRRYLISHENWHFTWNVYSPNDTVISYLDAFSPNTSNWMRYINCACTVDDENMYIYQLDNEIYYVTYECIKAGTELFIWYGSGYGDELGLKRLPGDYMRRFGESHIRYVVENRISDDVNLLYKDCYKFYAGSPFERPWGTIGTFDKYCLYEGSYEVCRFKLCNMNPCTERNDCQECQGYCLHLGKYIKVGDLFRHADKTNNCKCHKDGHSGCTTAFQSLERLCS